MKIAILGTRGIPAAYSGFETAAEELACRLSERGHERRSSTAARTSSTASLAAYKGARLVHLPTIQNKYLDTFVHTLLSAIHAARVTRPDVALFFIAGNSPLCRITRAAVDPDRDQHRRPGLRPPEVAGAGQGLPALRRARRAALCRSARSPTATRSPTPTSAATGSGSASCPTASPTRATTAARPWTSSGWSRGEYILFVGRLEPENNPHLLVEAFSPDRHA